MSVEVEYDADELVYRSPGALTGILIDVTVFPEIGDDELSVLARVGDDVEPEEVDEFAGAVAARYLADRYPNYDPYERGADWSYDWAGAVAGETGVWGASPEPPHRPWRHENVGDVFAVGDTPLGATRGPQGTSEDFRWVYVAPVPGGKPDVPLKRLTSMAHELGRPAVMGHQWSRVHYGARRRPDLELRLTGTQPRAALLVSVTPGDPMPTRIRVDLRTLNSWLARQVAERTDE